MVILAGTGHRPPKLGGYSDSVYASLILLARKALEYQCPHQVISGMALGWDQALAEAAISLHIPLIAAVPHKSQASMWPQSSKQKYQDILSKALQVEIVSNGPYQNSMMQFRNEWMVDRCGLLLALWNGSPGGTFNCIRYVKRQHKPIVNLWDQWVVMIQQQVKPS